MEKQIDWRTFYYLQISSPFLSLLSMSQPRRPIKFLFHGLNFYGAPAPAPTLSSLWKEAKERGSRSNISAQRGCCSKAPLSNFETRLLQLSNTWHSLVGNTGQTKLHRYRRVLNSASLSTAQSFKLMIPSDSVCNGFNQAHASRLMPCRSKDA